MASSIGHRGGGGHNRSHSTQMNQRVQLANAYTELGKELGSEKLKVVGGYTLGRVIGEGTYGSVHIATHRLTATRCAVKKIPKSLTSQLTREIHHHRLLHHPHILQLYEVLATESNIWLVSELCTGGELFDYLVERGRLLEGETRRLFGELVVAVGVLHKKGTVHRDLKLENVLLDGHCRIKLGDLGFAREWTRGNKLLETFCGTTGYACPEVLRGDKYNGEEADIWSLGIILYTLLCGGLPFDDDDEDVMKSLISKGEYEEPDWLSSEAKSLIKSILQQEPTSRLPIKSILSHPWFKKRIIDPPLNTIAGAEPGIESPRILSPDMDRHDVPFFSDIMSSRPAPSPSLDKDKKPDRLLAHAANKLKAEEDRLTEVSPFSSPRINGVDRINTDLPSVLSESTASSGNSFCLDSGEDHHSSADTAPTTVEPGSGSEQHSPTMSKHDLEPLSESVGGTEEPGTPSIMAHSNASESTIRKPEENPSRRSSLTGASTSFVNKRVTLLAEQKEEEEDEDELGHLPPSFSFEETMLHLPVGARSRTPSRTKRRSVSSTISERRPNMLSSNSFSLDAIPVVDYLAQLEAISPAPFSTEEEKQLLSSLDLLGFDIGQLKHSVTSDAADSSSAMWWMLRVKQMERAEQEAEREAQRVLNGLSAEPQVQSPGGRGTPSKSKLAIDTSSLHRDDVFQNRGDHPPRPPPKSPKKPDTIAPAMTLGPPVSNARRPSISPEKWQRDTDGQDTTSHSRSEPSGERLSRQEINNQYGQSYSGPSTIARSNSPEHSAAENENPPYSPSTRTVQPTVTAPSSPSRRTDVGKTRSPSFSMLQKATNALGVSSLSRKKSEEKLLEEAAKGSPDMRSPNKLLKSPPLGKGREIADIPPPVISEPKPSPTASDEEDARSQHMLSANHYPRSMTQDSLTSAASSGVSMASTPSKPTKDKGKREGLLTTFRSWFEVDKRKKRRPSPSPAVTLSRNSSLIVAPVNLRSAHYPAIKKTTTVVARRASDGRPHLHSRRSSSINSRRSSITSAHVQMLELPGQASPEPMSLSRRHSRRSGGSRTPTSDHEFGSRPSSLHSSHQPAVYASGSASGGFYRVNADSTTSLVSAQGGSSLHPGRVSGSRQQHRFPSGHSSRYRSGRSSTGPSARNVSGTSSGHSVVSSRRSSGADVDLVGDAESEADHSHDEADSMHSRPRSYYGESHLSPLQPSQMIASRRSGRSPRVPNLLLEQRLRRVVEAGLPIVPKPPIRDVFAKKDADEEWVSEDEDCSGFAGGLGQVASRSTGSGISGETGSGTSSLDSPCFKSGFASRLPTAGTKSRSGGRVSKQPALDIIPSLTNVDATAAIPKPAVVMVSVPVGRLGRTQFQTNRPADITEEEEEEEE